MITNAIDNIYNPAVIRRVRLKRSVVAVFILFFTILIAGEAVAVPNVWQSNGPSGAAISAIAVAPSDSSIIYLGSNGGIFKTSDGGISWVGASNGLTDVNVKSVAVEPLNPLAVYAGTASGGIFKSTDGGGNWTVVNNGLGSLQVLALACDPVSSGVLYAGTLEQGVYKSVDAGAHWVEVSVGLPVESYTVSSLRVDWSNPQILYVTGDLGSGIYKSINGAGSWQQVNVGLTNTQARSVAIHPTNSSILFAATDGGGVFKSEDAAGSWVPVNTGLTSLATVALAVGTDPQGSLEVYVVTKSAGIFKSLDQGATWAAVNAGLSSLKIAVVAVDPNQSARVYLGTTDVGLFKSTDGAASWSLANNGLSATYVTALAADPVNRDVFYAAANTGLYKSWDGAISWQSSGVGLGAASVQALLIDHTNPAILYAATYGSGIYKSTDGAGTWNAVNVGMGSLYVYTLALNPVDSSVLYAGTFGGVFKSLDGGLNWVSSSVGLSDLYVRALAVDPSSPNIIFAGTNAGGVFRSLDGGSSWSAVNTGLTSAYVVALTLDPLHPGTVYAYAGTNGGGVFKSTNGGESWTAINSGLTNLSIRAVAVNPIDLLTVYAATQGGGVFKTTTGGEQWISINQGLSVKVVNALMLDPFNPATVLAGTNGGGVFKVTTAPDLTIAPAALAFGSVPVGTTAQQTVTFTNSGMSVLHVNSMSVVGADSNQFVITDNTCASEAVALKIGASCTFVVNFTPVSGGYKSADLEIVSDAVSGATKTVPLAGAVQYTIGTTITAGSGTIVCSPNPVYHGETSSCSVTPDSGYYITSIYGCGGIDPGTQAYEAAYSYETGSVTSDCTVTAEFAVDTFDYYCDDDSDGYVDSQIDGTCAGSGCEPQGCQTTPGNDCNDSNPLEHPNQTWYKDTDNDLYSSGDIAVQCSRPAGYKTASELTATSGDCDDGNAAIKPGATEICDSIDNDCDGLTDEGIQYDLTTSVNPPEGGSVTPDCSGVCTYTCNAQVILTATAASGSQFTGWSGDSDCSDGQITMDADKTCTANFTKTRFQETDPAISYTGRWNIYSCPSCSGGAVKYSNNQLNLISPANAVLSFNGTGIKWVAAKANMLGKAKVYLDGRYMGLIDLYSAAPQYQVILFQKTGLTPGTHSIAIHFLGQKNLRSKGYHIDIDAFEVIP